MDSRKENHGKFFFHGQFLKDTESFTMNKVQAWGESSHRVGDDMVGGFLEPTLWLIRPWYGCALNRKRLLGSHAVMPTNYFPKQQSFLSILI